MPRSSTYMHLLCSALQAQQQLDAEAAGHLAVEHAAALQTQLLDADRGLDAAELAAQVLHRVDPAPGRLLIGEYLSTSMLIMDMDGVA